MSEDFHLIDLVFQARAPFKVQRVLVGTTDTEKLAWLAERGRLEPDAVRLWYSGWEILQKETKATKRGGA